MSATPTISFILPLLSAQYSAKEPSQTRTVNEPQPLNAESGITCTSSGIVTYFKLEQFAKKEIGISVIPRGNVTSDRDVQSEKALTPPMVMLSWKLISFNPEQLEKAPFGMLVSVFGIVTDVRELQPKNALSSREESDGGSSKSDKAEQYLKASF